MKYEINRDENTITGYGLASTLEGIAVATQQALSHDKSQLTGKHLSVTTNLGTIRSKAWADLIKQLAELGGAKLKSRGKAITRNGIATHCNIHVKFDYLPDAQVDNLVESISSVSEVLELDKVTTASIENTTVEQVNEESLSVKDILAEASKLYNEEDEKGSRNLLKDFAEKYNVQLSIRKKFENMMIDFEVELESA